MLVYHVVTIILIMVSWLCNFTRIGSLLLIVHDAADLVLEVCKLQNNEFSKNNANLICY